MSDFNYIPAPGSGGEDDPRVLIAQFGEGYAAQAPDGINPIRRTRNLNFENIARSDGEAIKTFLAGKVGQSFTWTPVGESERRWRQAGAVRIVDSGPLTVNLTVTFEEWFGP